MLIICESQLYFILFYFFSMCFSQLLQHEQLYSCQFYPHFQPGKHSSAHLEILLTCFSNCCKSSEHTWNLSTCFLMLVMEEWVGQEELMGGRWKRR